MDRGGIDRLGNVSYLRVVESLEFTWNSQAFFLRSRHLGGELWIPARFELWESIQLRLKLMMIAYGIKGPVMVLSTIHNNSRFMPNVIPLQRKLSFGIEAFGVLLELV